MVEFNTTHGSTHVCDKNSIHIKSKDGCYYVSVDSIGVGYVDEDEYRKLRDKCLTKGLPGGWWWGWNDI